MDCKYVKVTWESPKAQMKLPEIVEIPYYVSDEDAGDYISDYYGEDVLTCKVL